MQVISCAADSIQQVGYNPGVPGIFRKNIDIRWVCRYLVVVYLFVILFVCVCTSSTQALSPEAVNISIPDSPI